MKRIATLVIGIAVLMLAPSSEARRPSKVRVGLISLSASGKGATKVASKTTQAVAKSMRRNRRISVMVFNPRRSAKLRQCMQVSDCVKAVGRKLHLQYLISGQVLKLGRNYHVDMMVVSRATGAVVTNGTYEVHSPWAAKTSGARLALSLVNKARSGIRVASASTTASDAAVLTNAPLFSRSEAESAANILEERDEENPLTRGDKAKTASAAAVATAAEASAADLSPSATSAAPAEVMVNKEPGLASRLLARRYVHAWSVAGAGVAALGAGVAFGVISSNANSAAQDAQFQREAWLERDKAKKNALTANILYGVGGAAVLTSVVLFYLEHRNETRERRNDRDLSLQLQVAQQGGGVTVTGSF